MSSGQAISNPTEAQLENSIEKPAPVNASTLEPGFHRLDPRQITTEFISGAILSLIFSFIGLVAVSATWFAFDTQWHWYLFCAGVGLVLSWLWFMTIFWPRREYNYASWKLDDVGLEIRKGVLWRHRITVPRPRIQHVDVSQGPLQRNFGLAELTIHTAGTQNSSVKLEGLAYPVAIELRDELISNRSVDDAV